MTIQFLWYNAAEEEYQIGDRAAYKKIVNNINDAQNFIILEKFVNLSERVNDKLKSRIRSFNSYRKTRHLELA